MLDRLLDWWWDRRTAAADRRARTRPVRLPADTSISVAGYPYCSCGHVANVHRHYRDGNDCSQCDCRSYNTTWRTTP